jgi:hypothetical protein
MTVKAGDIRTTTFGKTGVEVSVIAQGGARMDLHPDVRTAAEHVGTVYDLGVTYFHSAQLRGRTVRRSLRRRATGRPDGRLPHEPTRAQPGRQPPHRDVGVAGAVFRVFSRPATGPGQEDVIC